MPDVMTGGECIAAMLAEEGVDTVFGIVDGTYMGLYGSFEKYEIRLISPRHETSAAHMAGAYARLTGKLGVCMASNGPGVANILPGVAVEQAEGNRVLLITSSRRQGIVNPIREGGFQCFDQVGVIGKMAKFSASVQMGKRLPEIFHAAFRRLFAGRPGLVHVDVAETIMNGPVPAVTPAKKESYRRTSPLEASEAAVSKAADLLSAAKQPLIHAGSGILHTGAFDLLDRTATLLAAPVTTSFGARSALPDSHPCSLPVYAMEAVNEARRSADLILVLGSRLGETDWWGSPPYWGKPGEQQTIQVDLDETMLGLNRPTDLAICADVSAFLAKLVKKLEEKPIAAVALALRRKVMAGYREACSRIRRELDEALDNSAAPMHTSHVPAACRALPDDTVLVVDGGNTAVFANFYHQVRSHNSLLSTNKFGMLGAGVSQALGAKIARPEAEVVCILGDGAMGFHLQEIETAVRHSLQVIYLVVCDKQWGMVKLTQQVGLSDIRQAAGIEDGGTIATDLGPIAFDELARSMGAHGERVEKPGDLAPAIERCRASGKPAVIHVDVDPVMHLFAPGLDAFKAMHQEPGG